MRGFSEYLNSDGEVLTYADVSPPFDIYKGRDTSMYAMTEFPPSETRQDMADECDINILMKKYEQTGLFPQPQGRQPFYVDATDLPTYQEALNMIMAADDAFNALPASIRREFDNNPAKFVEFAEDPKNAQKLKEWGMLSPEAVARFDSEAAQAAASAAEAQHKADPAAPAPAPAAQDPT